jgi:integrase/recombinase XerD
MQKITISANIRRDKINKLGQRPIFLFWIKKGKTMKISLSMSVPEESWQGTEPNWVSEKGRGKYHLARQINAKIEKEIRKARDILFEFEMSSKDIEFEQFKALLLGIEIVTDKDKDDFFAFIESVVVKKRKDGVKEQSLRLYNNLSDKVKQFKETVYLQDIDSDFVYEFKNFLINDRKNATNTIARCISQFRSVVRRAIKKKIIEADPFEDVKIEYDYTKKPTLSSEDIVKLERLYQAQLLRPALQEGLRILLFSCYTGMPYGEIKKLAWEDIEIYKVEDIEVKCISQKRQKTKIAFFVPLIPRAEKLLPEKTDKENVFKLPPGHRLNEAIVEVLTLIGFTKRFSIHSARHTFATIAVNEGIPMHVVKQVLGHSKIEMTEHYSQLQNITIIKALLDHDKRKQI